MMLKYQCLKDKLEEKEGHDVNNEEEGFRRMEEVGLQLKDQLLHLCSLALRKKSHAVAFATLDLLCGYS